MAKIKYGLSNVYYAVATDNGSGVLSYATPVAWPGAVSLSLDAEGETNTFYADNIAYYVSNANSGYSGDFESALIPDSFRTAVLGEVLDAKGFYVETAEAPTVEFALMFQFENDDKNTRHVLYRCTASRPSVAGNTAEASIEPQTESITLTAMPRVNDHVIKARAPFDEGADSSYSKWFTAVQEPTA